MREHHALRRAGRARGVDERGHVLPPGVRAARGELLVLRRAALRQERVPAEHAAARAAPRPSPPRPSARPAGPRRRAGRAPRRSRRTRPPPRRARRCSGTARACCSCRCRRDARRRRSRPGSRRTTRAGCAARIATPRPALDAGREQRARRLTHRVTVARPAGALPARRAACAPSPAGSRAPAPSLRRPRGWFRPWRTLRRPPVPVKMIRRGRYTAAPRRTACPLTRPSCRTVPFRRRSCGSPSRTPWRPWPRPRAPRRRSSCCAAGACTRSTPRGRSRPPWRSRGNRVLAVGSDAEIAPLVGSATRVVELAGRSVVPGFNDSHAHLLGIGFGRLDVDLVGTRSFQEVVERVAAAVQDAAARRVGARPRLARGQVGLAGARGRARLPGPRGALRRVARQPGAARARGRPRRARERAGHGAARDRARHGRAGGRRADPRRERRADRRLRRQRAGPRAGAAALAARRSRARSSWRWTSASRRASPA